MNSIFKSVFIKIKLTISRLLVHFLIQITKLIINYTGIKLSITNNTNSKIDGIGAQLQRLLSIVAFCDYANISFVQEKFMDVSVHPLDPFQNSISKINFINKINFLFKYKGKFKALDKNCIEIAVPSLNAFSLLKITLLCIIRNKSVLIKTIEPYAITNYYNDICLNMAQYFPNWGEYIKDFEMQVHSDVIYIHFRQGVGGLVIYPGQKISREMPLNYYFSKIKQIQGTSPNLNKIFIFTDAPVADLKFTPEVNQKFHWEGTPGFSEGELYVRGNDLELSFFSKGFDVTVESGGDPIDAIAMMSLSSYLITSRSSLSYVAGLLNTNGVIYYSDDFWHPKPSAWH
jgi:hypothetical protein